MSRVSNLIIDHIWAPQEGHLLPWLAVAMGGGVMSYFLLPFEPSLTLRFWLCALAGLGLWLAWPRVGWRRAALCFLALTIGFQAAAHRTESLQHVTLKQEAGPATIFGRVVKVDPLPKGWQVTLDRLDINHLKDFEQPHKIRLTHRIKADRDTPPPVGARVRVFAKVMPPNGPVLPGGFDFRRHAYFQGLAGYGYTMSVMTVVREPKADDLNAMLGRNKAAMSLRIGAAMTSPHDALAKALLLGEKKALPDSLAEDLRFAGLAHLLAISGMHVGLVAGMVYGLLRFLLAAIPVLALRVSTRSLAAAGGIVTAFAYMMLVGAPVPTQRAFIMVSLAFIALMLGRWPFSLRLVAVAAIFVLLIQPESLMGPSFQMSFAAVTALIWAFDATRSYWRRPPPDYLSMNARWRRRVLKFLIGSAFASLVASLATAPFALYHFQRLSLLSIVTNIAATPLMFPIMAFGLLGMVVMPFGLEALPLKAMELLLDQLVRLAETAATFDAGVLHLHIMPPPALFCLSLAVVTLCFWRGWGKAVALVPLCVAFMLWSAVELPAVLMNRSGTLIGVYDAQTHTLTVSSRRKDRFTREIWVAALGNPTVEKDEALLETYAAEAEGSQTARVLTANGEWVSDVSAARPWNSDAVSRPLPSQYAKRDE